MGVGPPRFGLRPGVGKRPGVDPSRLGPVELRVVQYPSDDAFPGRGVYPFARFATRPSTTLYPGTDLLIHVPVSRTDKRVSFELGGGFLSRRLGHFLRRVFFTIEASAFSESSLRSSLPPAYRVRFAPGVATPVRYDSSNPERVPLSEGHLVRVRVR